MTKRRDTLHELLVDRDDVDARSVALLGPDASPIRYGDLARRIHDIGAWLASQGLARARIAIVMPNGVDMAQVTLGVATYGICAPLDPSQSERECRDAFAQLRVDALIAGDAAGEKARSAARTCAVRVLGVPIAAATGSPQATPAPPGRDDIALLLRTSGTTSTAKCVALTHAQLCRSAADIATTLRLSPADRCLGIMPLFHVHGFVAALLASLHAGASVVCTPGFASGRFVEWLNAFDPTWYTGVPTMHQAILAEVEASASPPLRTRLRFVRSCSAALPRAIATRLERAFDAPVIEAYGMTEATHQITSQTPTPIVRRDNSVGASTGANVAIMDATGHVLPRLAQGEVVIRGETVITAYDGGSRSDADAFTAVWLRTGDEGWLDEDGRLHLAGRIKELINRGGEKISPREVEDALLEQDGVVECVAFAVSHPTLGEDVAAAVVPAVGVWLDPDALRHSLFGRLSNAKIPSRIVVVDGLPKGPTGKVARTRMAAELATELATPFVAPANDVEAAIAAMMSDLLGAERVGAVDNFFALGGDSLRGAQLLSRMHARFAIALAPAMLFRWPTPRELAANIAKA